MKNSTALRAATVAFLSVITAFFCLNAAETVTGDSSGVTLTLPEQILGIQGVEIPVSQAEKDSLPPDTQYDKASYRLPDGNVMSYSIVLSGESRNSIHRPEVCLPGQGWFILEEEVRPVDIGGGQILHVKDLTLEQDFEDSTGKLRTLQAHYYYWFVGRDVTTPKHVSRILLTSYDNVFRNVNHRWAYVALMSFVGATSEEGGSTNEETQRGMDEFIAASVREFQQVF